MRIIKDFITQPGSGAALTGPMVPRLPYRDKRKVAELKANICVRRARLSPDRPNVAAATGPNPHKLDDQIRVGRQPQDCKSAGPHRAADAARSRRRGDRVGSQVEGHNRCQNTRRNLIDSDVGSSIYTACRPIRVTLVVFARSNSAFTGIRNVPSQMYVRRFANLNKLRQNHHRTMKG